MFGAILFGLLAAFAQSCSYIFSKRYIAGGGGSFQLLLCAHLVMGLFSVVLLLFLIPYVPIPPLQQYWWPLIACSLFYLIGQFSFFMALKHAEASRLSPLLALKIVIVALLSISFYGGSCNAWQLLAVLLCVGGAMLSNWSGGTVSRLGLIYLISACFWYSWSDIYIKKLITALDSGHTASGVLAAALSYLLTGAVAVLFLKMINKPAKKDIPIIIGFSVVWYSGVMFLFVCFMLSNPIFGNILQSSRGIISVLLGAWLAHRGYSYLETKISRNMVIKRVFAALLMTLAVILFVLDS